MEEEQIRPLLLQRNGQALVDVEENVVWMRENYRPTLAVHNAKRAHRFALDPVVAGWTFNVCLDSRTKPFECDADEICDFVGVTLNNEAAITCA